MQRLEAELGKREPSVRELFRTASRLAKTFIMRPASAGHHHHPLHGAAAGAAGDASVSVSAHAGGDGMRARSRSVEIARPGRQAGGAEGPLDVGGGSSVWPAGSRPSTPEDQV